MGQPCILEIGIVKYSALTENTIKTKTPRSYVLRGVLAIDYLVYF